MSKNIEPRVCGALLLNMNLNINYYAGKFTPFLLQTIKDPVIIDAKAASSIKLNKTGTVLSTAAGAVNFDSSKVTAVML